ncbi:ring-cleaving dioxygenase [Salinisphaera sp. S4-8]|uniref:ring-cleaving dioxygenase n=1 Tax=Salinisphaera sp. S4-8 TaxID=633357 RepID=UPI0033425EA3
MTSSIAGLHHITAICGDPVQNRRFFAEVLGLRLVKKTVNFDDPGTYHLYYGDEVGTPGTVLTFFAFADAPAGQHGLGGASEIAFAVPRASLDFWQTRLAAYDIESRRQRRFDDEVLCFTGPHGNRFALVASEAAGRIDAWHDAPVAGEYAIRGLYGVSINIAELALSAGVIEQVLGFERSAQAGDRVRFVAHDNPGPGAVLDVCVVPEMTAQRQGVGSVHHVAFRASDEAEQSALRKRLVDRGLQVTEAIDREYFMSIYFREPGGVLFEIATDGPGFVVDEPVAQLGSGLMLPPQYENQRGLIERALGEIGS